MPDKYTKYEFFDEEPDDADDARFLPSPVRFTPSPQSRFQRLELMPPPSATSTMATRALQKEFKAVVKAQKDGELPFYIDPDTDRRVPSYVHPLIVSAFAFLSSLREECLNTDCLQPLLLDCRALGISQICTQERYDQV